MNPLIMDTVSLLSEESLDLCSSFDSEVDNSFETTPLNFHCIRNNDDNLSKSSESSACTKKLAQSSEMDFLVLNNAGNPFSQNNCSDVSSIFSTPENRSLSMVKMFGCLSLNDGQFPLSSKIKEFKSILSEVNDTYVNLLTIQFLLNSYKIIQHKVSPELARKVEAAIEGSIVDKLSVLKSNRGERYQLLGLEKDQICNATKGTLSSIEKALLSNQVVSVLESNVQHLSSQRKVLRGEFGARCQKVVQPDSLLSEERERLADLHNCVQNQLEQACQLLVSTNQLMQQLAHTLENSQKDLVVASFTSLREKAAYLQSTACVLRLKMEERLYKDKNQTKAMNTLGSELKTSVDALAEELKSLQKTQGEYEKKEETSRQYKELVADYAKTKRQLHHKYQTLSLLNDPDISFS